MKETTTRAKLIDKADIFSLLVDETAFEFRLARNLSLLAGDILTDNEKKTPEVIGKRLLEAVDMLPMEEHMAICRYYGLIGPKYWPESFSTIAKDHHTTSKRISNLKERGISKLRKCSSKSLFHRDYKERAEDMLAKPARYVSISFLYNGFKGTNAYYIFKKMGVNYIQDLLYTNIPKLDEDIAKAGYDLRFCDLLGLVARAQKFEYSEEMLNTVVIEGEGGLIYQEVADLDEFLANDTIEALIKNDFRTVNEFLNMNKLQIQVAVSGHLLQIAEIERVREKLGFPVKA